MTPRDTTSYRQRSGSNTRWTIAAIVTGLVTEALVVAALYHLALGGIS